MTNNLDSKTHDKGFIKLSEMIADPLVKVYKAGQLGLVFIFIGLLLTISAQMNADGKYSNITFILGIILISTSFILFLFLQIKNPISKTKNLDKGKEVVDNLQELSINFISLIGRLQTFSFKYINDIDVFISSGLPYIQKIPFIPEKIKSAGLKAQEIQSSVVDFAEKSERVIKEVEEALVTSDIKKFQSYTNEIKKLNAQISTLLKK